MSILSRIMGRFRPEKPLDDYSRAEMFRQQGVVIGPNVRITGYCHFGSEPYFVEIGADTVVSGDVTFLTHDGAVNVCKKTLGQGITKFGRIRVGRGCFVGARSILLPGVTVGDGAVVGTGSVVTRDVPPGEVWAGNPAHFIKTVTAYAEKVAATCRTAEQAELRDIVNRCRGLA